MAFKKQVLVLKDVLGQAELNTKQLSGIARIEIESGVAEFYLSLINLPVYSGGEFFALVIDKNRLVFNFALGARPTSIVKMFDSLPNISEGVAVGVYVVKDNLPLTIAFARTDEKAPSLCEFKKSVAEKQLEALKLCKQKEIKQSFSHTNNTYNSVTQEQELKSFENYELYNDEAVATENYYEFDREINQKLNSVKDFNQNVSLENERFNTPSNEKTQKDNACIDGTQNETDTRSCKEQECATPYAKRVEQELNRVFENFPQEERLQKIFADSRWAKIHYSKDKYYVVGVIKEQGEQKYICYGVPAHYSPTPPEQLKGFCSFVPASIFNMTGEGFWMLFQDAKTGKCVLCEQ